ncbi:hypothetical protein BW686_20895 [Pseudomonas syringae]|uniref:Uncharacterized protein n=1 Tax=Pseudomonas syringae TaxID=317 RepID=A0A244EM70_PSESX|nr:hypothetical protein BW686_20895 [Pseudomonas syringae]
MSAAVCLMTYQTINRSGFGTQDAGTEAGGVKAVVPETAIPVGVSLLTKTLVQTHHFRGCTGLFASKLAPTKPVSGYERYGV